MEKVYFRSQILVHEYWTILDHFGIPVLFASGCNQHDFKNINITFLGNTGTPDMFQYSTILGRSSIRDLKYTFSGIILPYLIHPNKCPWYLTKSCDLVAYSRLNNCELVHTHPYSPDWLCWSHVTQYRCGYCGLGVSLVIKSNF